MSWFKWQPGRQAGVYKKLLLARSRRLRMDAWLIDYEAGTKMPVHFDEVPGRQHWRVNLVLKTGGGCFRMLKNTAGIMPLRIGERVLVFRSDEYHLVTELTGRRIVLSFGWAK